MKSLSPDEIRVYHDTVNPLDKSSGILRYAGKALFTEGLSHPALGWAGAYAIQFGWESGESIVERIDGSYSNVMGLPVERLRVVLEQAARPVTSL
jgi:predicted house-cleaning NTP pyrophosphatase (Maf/HAM1 superfamily)